MRSRHENFASRQCGADGLPCLAPHIYEMIDEAPELTCLPNERHLDVNFPRDS
jgi:hypothetical protein